MAAPLLSTKLYRPPPRPGVIRRARLFDRLDTSPGHPLTLIVAPAGFGKTTLISDWLAERQKVKGKRQEEADEPLFPSPFDRFPFNVAWLSLGPGERSPERFFAYLVVALQSCAQGVGAAALAALRSAQPPPPETLCTMLLNDLAALDQDLLLVLDDYHTADAPPINAALAFLLDQPPPRLHLVIATRSEPDLPLARLRARGQLVEIRMADLRFTPAEAAAFLDESMGLAVAAPDVAELEQRTEGWVAGLQMAALALRGHADPHRFIQSFSGGHRFVLDYLVGEALLRQPADVRRFLLQTAILDRLCAELCDAILKDEGGGLQAEHLDESARRSDSPLILPPSSLLLEQLERANLFLVPLDDERRWYRYHHLFAEALQALLARERPGAAATLHGRAATWFERQGLPHEAIRHALAARAFEQAAVLIEREWPAMDASYQSAPWLEWARALPEPLILARPVLCLGYGWALLNGGDLEGAAIWLQRAESWAIRMPQAGAGGQGAAARPDAGPLPPPAVDPAQLQALPASIAGARAYRALAMGDIAATLRYARQALDADVERTHPSQIQATAMLGFAQWASGDLVAADRSLSAFAAWMLESGRVVDAIGMAFILGEVRITLGRLHDAFAAYEHSLVLMARQGQAIPYGSEDIHRGLADLYLERGDLQRAQASLATGEAIGARGATLTDWRQRLHLTQARLRISRGDLAGALERLDEAERRFIRTPLPDHRPIAAWRARVHIRQGDLDAALGWARRHGVTTDLPPSYLREFEQITLARLLIARAQAEDSASAMREALQLLDRLLRAAEAGGRNGSALEILILQALARHAQGDAAAIEPLRHALALAEPEGFVRPFADEGAPIAELLRLAEQRNIAPAFTRRLLAAAGGPPAPAPSLPEPLTERELTVLRLLATELSGPELAQALAVSLNTLRTHTKSIYAKLGVGSRRAALRRSEELGIL